MSGRRTVIPGHFCNGARAGDPGPHKADQLILPRVVSGELPTSALVSAKFECHSCGSACSSKYSEANPSCVSVVFKEMPYISGSLISKVLLTFAKMPKNNRPRGADVERLKRLMIRLPPKIFMEIVMLVPKLKRLKYGAAVRAVSRRLSKRVLPDTGPEKHEPDTDRSWLSTDDVYRMAKNGMCNRDAILNAGVKHGCDGTHGLHAVALQNFIGGKQLISHENVAASGILAAATDVRHALETRVYVRRLLGDFPQKNDAVHIFEWYSYKLDATAERILCSLYDWTFGDTGTVETRDATFDRMRSSNEKKPILTILEEWRNPDQRAPHKAHLDDAVWAIVLNYIFS